jgi:TolA-binding protein
MVMKFPRTIFCVLGFLLILGCSDKAKDLFETAVFEENQNNVPHAKELYEELIRAHPSSKQAELAKARLADLQAR